MTPTSRKQEWKLRKPSALGTSHPQWWFDTLTADAASLSPRCGRLMASPPALTVQKSLNATLRVIGDLNHAQSEKTH